MALQSKILLGEESKSNITVEPVVVIPDMLSKKESVIDKFNSEKKKGRDPNAAILNQDKAVNIKACCVFINFKCKM